MHFGSRGDVETGSVMFLSLKCGLTPVHRDSSTRLLVLSWCKWFIQFTLNLKLQIPLWRIWRVSVSSLTWQPPLHTGKSLVGPERWDIWPWVEWHRSNMCSMADKSCQPARWCTSHLIVSGWTMAGMTWIVIFILESRHRKSDQSQDVPHLLPDSWVWLIHRSAGLHPACTGWTQGLYQGSSETILLLRMNLLINWLSVVLWSYHTTAASFHSNRMLILLRATCTEHHSFIRI